MKNLKTLVLAFLALLVAFWLGRVVVHIMWRSLVSTLAFSLTALIGTAVVLLVAWFVLVRRR